MTALLSACDLHFRHPGAPVGLDGLSLDVRAGETLAILGANGAGKTTLLLHLNGSLRPARGTLRWRGEPLGYGARPLACWRSRVGLVLQNADDQLFAGSAAEDVSFGPLNLGLGDVEVRVRVAQALADLEIDHLADRPIHRLSAGEKRRVAIAGVLAMRPEVLVLDEPFAGLDPQAVRHLLGVLDGLARAGTTIVYATHDVDLALGWSDRAVLFAHGRVIAEGDPADVLDDDAALTRARLFRPMLLAMARQAVAAGLLDARAAKPRSTQAFIDALGGALPEQVSAARVLFR